MRFWIREIGGWLLIMAGGYFFLIALSLVLSNPAWPLTSIAPTIIGVFVFRGGIHLLKVSMAARVALITQAIPVKKPEPQAMMKRKRLVQEEW